MKRILAAVSFAVLATPAFAVQVSAPYEDTQNDRALPNVQTTGQRSTTGMGVRVPYIETDLVTKLRIWSKASGRKSPNMTSTIT